MTRLRKKRESGYRLQLQVFISVYVRIYETNGHLHRMAGAIFVEECAMWKSVIGTSWNKARNRVKTFLIQSRKQYVACRSAELRKFRNNELFFFTYKRSKVISGNIENKRLIGIQIDGSKCDCTDTMKIKRRCWLHMLAILLIRPILLFYLFVQLYENVSL